LDAEGLSPPADAKGRPIQEEWTVTSFGFQWGWDPEPRTEEDLKWRVAERHNLTRRDYAGRTVLDAGAGAGDQSRWILRNGAAAVVSVDLSDAVNVAYDKLQGNRNWIGIQGDISALPFAEPFFDFVYCEGVIQHTQSSEATVRELARVLRPGGRGVATHYSIPESLKLRAQLRLRNWLRTWLSGMEPSKLLLVSGVLAAFAQAPLIGDFFGKTIAVKNPRMPTFKSTWSATYDTYGSHTYQRHLSPAAFLASFDLPGIAKEPSPGGGVVFRKMVPQSSSIGAPGPA
jgi:ubiquinone/menaquinone biosynthesis C-methylase UbiE